jgi:hypothetical protein
MTGINNSRLKKDKLKFTADYKISPIYQAIRDIDKQGIKFGEPTGIRTQDQELKRLLLYR